MTPWKLSVDAALMVTLFSTYLSWDRNQKRRHHSSQQSELQQQESQQPLTDLSPATVSILGPYSDSQVPTPEMVESGQVLEGLEKLEGLGKSSAFQLNR